MIGRGHFETAPVGIGDVLYLFKGGVFKLGTLQTRTRSWRSKACSVALWSCGRLSIPAQKTHDLSSFEKKMKCEVITHFNLGQSTTIISGIYLRCSGVPM
jgi:hypothetical protein